MKPNLHLKDDVSSGILSLMFLFVTISMQAQQTDGSTASPGAPAQITATDSASTDGVNNDKDGKISFSGYFDTYYFTNLNRPSSRNNLGSSGISRGFDRY